MERLLNTSFSEIDKEYSALFALQTAYVIIVKIVGYRIASIVRYDKSFIDFESLSSFDNNALRLQLVSLEEGAIFRNYGITNLLEGDFFSWYSTDEQWSKEIAECISDIFKILNMYSDKSVLNSSSKSTDFFKELYQSMMPAPVRHSLGEYYTKQWIAQQVIDEALALSSVKNWKGIDPCCGFGTFITVMIDKVLDECVDKTNTEKLNEVLSRVKGIDLNPVAVLTARVNYFINIANLLNDQDEIEIPVYLGDSSYVPHRELFDNIECLRYTINTLVSPIEILVPASMVSNSVAFSKAMTEIEVHIKNLDESSAYLCLEKLVPDGELTHRIENEIHKLTSVLVELERRN